MLTLGDAIELLQAYISANLNAVDRVNQVCERFLKSTDPIGSLERVTFTVTADSDGQGFITLPERYEAIRGAVINPATSSPCGAALEIRNDRYEYAPGNLGMLLGSDAMRGIVPVPAAEGDTLRAFKVPVCPSEGAISYFTCICKRAWLMLTDDDSVLAIQNLGALKMGLKALDKEDAEDWVRANELWNMGKTLLAEETDNTTGSEALGKVQMEDDFCLGGLGSDYGYGFGFGVYGNWN
jgi:hypothetical protein